MPIANLLTQTCSLYRKGAKTTDDFGQESASFILFAVGDGRACRYQPASNSWKVKPELKYTRPTAKLYVETYTGLTYYEQDRIYITTLDRWVTVTKAQMDSSMDHWELEVEDANAVN